MGFLVREQEEDKKKDVRREQCRKNESVEGRRRKRKERRKRTKRAAIKVNVWKRWKRTLAKCE